MQWPHHGASVNVPNTVGFSRHKQCQLTHVPKRLGDIYEWFDGTVGSRWNAVERTEVDEHHLVVREDVIEVVLRTNRTPSSVSGFLRDGKKRGLFSAMGRTGGGALDTSQIKPATRGGKEDTRSKKMGQR